MMVSGRTVFHGIEERIANQTRFYFHANHPFKSFEVASAITRPLSPTAL